MEDRPFVPVSTVVLEGMPRDARVLMRKWKEGIVTTRVGSGGVSPTVTSGFGSDIVSPTISSPSGFGGGGGLQRGRSLRVVPLMAALEATRR